MRIKLKHIIFLFLATVLFSCEEQFNPDIQPNAENLLVVDGMISNMQGPYTVKLSMSSELNNPQYIPLSGFTVFILDGHGISYPLSETRPGTYVTTDDNFTGITGRSYKLQLYSPDGKSYESAFEKLREPTGIRAVDHELEIYSDENYFFDVAGYRFYVSSMQAPVDTNYYLWQCVSTFKYRADFGIYYMFDGQLRNVVHHDTLRVCYRTDTIPQIFLLSTENISPPVVSKFALNFVTTETRRLMERYSLLVRQFSISKDAYEFWKVIKEQNSNLGDLYSKQPFQVRGNIHNSNDEDEIVLGRFTAAGVSEKRVFVDKPKPPVRMLYPVCQLGEDTYRNFSAIFEFPPSSWPVFATRGPDGTALPNQWCMDCRESGGKIEKPDFWIDE